MLTTINRGFSHGYKEILFPKDSGLIPHGLHIWPRKTHMLMALANLDGSMTGTLYMDTDGSRLLITRSTLSWFSLSFMMLQYKFRCVERRRVGRSIFRAILSRCKVYTATHRICDIYVS
jgi:hypothetical protein